MTKFVNTNTQRELYLGVLSGTSIDGIDIALVAFENDSVSLIDAHTFPIASDVANQLKQLCVPSNDNEVERLASADRLFATETGNAVNTFLSEKDTDASEISAIGFHGQTIRHMPDVDPAFTLQIGCPDTLACLTGIPVVSQFRKKDVALGGQGAPLAPALHQSLFSSSNESRTVLNLGGIANITWLAKAGEMNGFDCGPASTLLDHWFKLHHPKSTKPYDNEGQWAASGRIINPLLDMFLSDPYFSKAPPKSTGREYFTPSWLNEHLACSPEPFQARDVQATLLELTARSITQAIEKYAPSSSVFCCGGGAHNQHLMARCRSLLPHVHWDNTSALGLNADWVEGVLFAWLAWRYNHQVKTDLTKVTGASRPTVLGSYTPAD